LHIRIEVGGIEAYYLEVLLGSGGVSFGSLRLRTKVAAGNVLQKYAANYRSLAGCQTT